MTRNDALDERVEVAPAGCLRFSLNTFSCLSGEQDDFNASL
jgi:hypothetical protein